MYRLIKVGKIDAKIYMRFFRGDAADNAGGSFTMYYYSMQNKQIYYRKLTNKDAVGGIKKKTLKK